MVIRSKPKANTLEHIYDTCNRLFKGEDCFYTQEELEQERAKENNVFLSRSEEKNEIRNNRVYNMVYPCVDSAVC